MLKPQTLIVLDSLGHRYRYVERPGESAGMFECCACRTTLLMNQFHGTQWAEPLIKNAISTLMACTKAKVGNVPDPYT